jgi:uncharacterized membrane protein (UPF0127 family)
MFMLKEKMGLLHENAWLVFAVSGPVLAAAIVVLLVIFIPTHPGEKRILIDGKPLYVSIASDEMTREQGLGGRESLAEDEGMLFVFPDDSVHAFWMKGMKFALDMLWIHDDGTIAYIQSDVASSTYPQVFAPSKPAGKYVLEVQAGYASQEKVKVGDKVDFSGVI